MLDAWELVAKSLVRLGRADDAIEAFGKVLAIEPLKPETHLALARIYALDRQPSRARSTRSWRRAAIRPPANEVLAELMMDAGRLGDAATFARRSVEADPSRYMSHFVLGVVAQREGRCPDAIAAFRRAIDAKRARAWRGRPQPARRAWRIVWPAPDRPPTRSASFRRRSPRCRRRRRDASVSPTLVSIAGPRRRGADRARRHRHDAAAAERRRVLDGGARPDRAAGPGRRARVERKGARAVPRRSSVSINTRGTD